MKGGGKIVNNTSMGVLLRGLIHIRNERGERYCVVAKDKLLENVTDSQVEVAKVVEDVYIDDTFYEQKDLMEFHERLNKTRNIIGGMAGLSVSGFSKLEIGVQKATDKKHKHSQEATGNTYHFSRIKSHIKYKLSLQLKGNVQLQLSKPALTSLEQIAETTTRKAEYEKCRDFFVTYGSHVDLGECRLGGVMEIAAECNDEAEKQKITDEEKTMTENLIAAHAKGGYSFINGKVEITAAALKKKLKQFKVESSRNLGSYKIRAAIYGGNDKSSLQTWDKSLRNDSTSLHIIDRGCLKYIYCDDGKIKNHIYPMPNHRSVWELLGKPPYGKASLKHVTFDEAANKMEVFYKIFLYRERIIEITNGIQEGPTSIWYYNALLDIFRVNEWRKNEVNNLNEWGEFIVDDNTILNFVRKLDSVSDLRLETYCPIKEMFKTLMQQVEVDHRELLEVKIVQKTIDSMDNKLPVDVLKSR